MKTAHQFAIENGFPDEKFKNGPFYNLMIEFAKMHVKEALLAAHNNSFVDYFMEEDTCVHQVDKDSILNAYPENLIK